jgi:hypothetical protein
VTERTLRVIAKELAAEMYENIRSAGERGKKFEVRDAQTGHVLRLLEPALFLKTFPNLKDYWSGRRHGYMERKIESSGIQVTYHVDDGQIYPSTPGWAFHYERARNRAFKMLGMSDDVVHPNIKEALYAAILEDREKQLKQEAQGIKPAPVPQRRDN